MNGREQEELTTGMTVGLRGAEVGRGTGADELDPAGIYRDPPVNGSPELVPGCDGGAVGGGAGLA